MTTADILARIRRLNELALGISKEIQLIEKAEDPLLYVERRDYVAGLCQLRVALETARVALAKAKQRIMRY